jgi:hypothetical protein
MDSIQADIPQYSTSFTIEVPAGDQRTLTVIAYDGAQRNTGGHATVDLVPGDEKIVQIQMLPIPTNIFPPYGSGSLAWDDAVIPGFTLVKYVIYESTTLNGDYIKSGETVSYECSSCGIAGNYYKVSAVYNIHGEGEQSDPFLMP